MRAKILFISFAYCLFLQANAQTENNTIVNPNSSWATLYYNIIFGVCSTTYHFFDGDSVVNGKTYQKLFYYKDEQHTKRFFEGFMREENKKTYFAGKLQGNKTTETILYDFSLKTGDTLIQEIRMSEDFWEITYSYISKCDTVIINGVQKKRMILKELGFDRIRDTVIESIGSLQGIMTPICYACIGNIKELLCYAKNDELLYQNPKYSKCYYDNYEELLSVPIIEQDKFSVFPNPAKDMLFITSENTSISQIDIFDIFGRKIYNEQLKIYNNKYEIYINNIIKGMYFVKITTDKKQILVYKFLKD